MLKSMLSVNMVNEKGYCSLSMKNGSVVCLRVCCYLLTWLMKKDIVVCQ